jgi:NTP pyrophosphatase (non-canonical NTP hydrolase)
MSDPNFHKRLAVRQLSQDDVDWIINEVREGRAKDPSLNQLATIVHKSNEKWWISITDGTPLVRNKGELLMLMVSELAEAMEGERKNQMDDHLPHRAMAEVELADCLIRIFDYAGAYGYDLNGAFWEKMAYNRQRADHKHEARLADGGKKW